MKLKVLFSLVKKVTIFVISKGIQSGYYGFYKRVTVLT